MNEVTPSPPALSDEQLDRASAEASKRLSHSDTLTREMAKLLVQLCAQAKRANVAERQLAQAKAWLNIPHTERCERCKRQVVHADLWIKP